MKNLKNINKTTVENSRENEIFKKHDVNLKSNSTLYFQIGLILCLLATYGLFEMNFKYQISNLITGDPIEEPDTFHLPEIVIEPNAPKSRPIEKQVAMLTDKPPIVKPNDFVIADPVEFVTPESSPTIAVDNPTSAIFEAPKVPINNKPFNMNDVEKVPIFPGCESASNNAERMACMSDKLTKLIQKRFNTDLAADLGLSGVQRIQVQFRIDDKGHVTDIKTRSPYSQLEKEAERVVNKIPVMTPGMQRNTPVSVVYYLPIAFQVH